MTGGKPCLRDEGGSRLKAGMTGGKPCLRDEGGSRLKAGMTKKEGRHAG